MSILRAFYLQTFIWTLTSTKLTVRHSPNCHHRTQTTAAPEDNRHDSISSWQQQLVIVQKQPLQVQKNAGTTAAQACANSSQQRHNTPQSIPSSSTQPCIVNWSRNLNTIQIKHNDNNKNLPKFYQKKHLSVGY